MNYVHKPTVIQAMQWDGTREGAERIQAAFPQIPFEFHANFGGRILWITRNGGHLDKQIRKGEFVAISPEGKVKVRTPEYMALNYEALEERSNVYHTGK